MNQLDRANELRDRITDITWFLGCVEPIRGNDKRNFIALQIHTETKISLCGSRHYGIGTRTAQHKIPFCVLEALKQECRREVEGAKAELEAMFTGETK
jgi:hypothetical protein